MVASAEILAAEGKVPDICGRYVGETQRLPCAARPHACAHVYFLLSPFCRRCRPAGTCLTPRRKERHDDSIKRTDLMQKS